MAGTGVIGDVSDALVHVLWEHFHQDRQFRSIDQIRIESPEDMQVTNIPQISLFLHRITDDPYLRHGSGEEIAAAPLAVRLHYLVTAYARERGVEHRILGEVLQLLHDHAILEVPHGKAAAESVPERLRVVLESPTSEELMGIWRALGKPCRLSACYQVRPVRLTAPAGWAVAPGLERDRDRDREGEPGEPEEDLDRFPRR
ncbi:MAG: DUF4255 domain-containing protein [Planctomycetes bacterium]|nr:DUF4255 domain-containing protein [Planctomycetota bacterium]